MSETTVCHENCAIASLESAPWAFCLPRSPRQVLIRWIMLLAAFVLASILLPA